MSYPSRGLTILKIPVPAESLVHRVLTTRDSAVRHAGGALTAAQPWLLLKHSSPAISFYGRNATSWLVACSPATYLVINVYSSLFTVQVAINKVYT